MTKSTYIAAMGHFHPQNRITNEFFGELDIGSDSEWVLDRTGIESRHSILDEETIAKLRYGKTDLSTLRKEGKVTPLAELACQSWEVLGSRAPANFDQSHVDAVICGTSVPDYDIPANASTISEKLGLRAASFDVNSACSSFVMDLHVARGLVGSGIHDNIAIFNPERYSLRMNYADRQSCVLFGDGCASALVQDKPQPGSLKVIDTMVVSDPSNYEAVKIPDSGLFTQNGKVVQKFAISKTIEATREILKKNDLTPNDISWFIGHQANLRMITSSAERLGISKETHLYNVDLFGNQGAAGAPAVVSQNWEKIQTGDLVAIAVVGSGLTWGAALLEKI